MENTEDSELHQIKSLLPDQKENGNEGFQVEHQMLKEDKSHWTVCFVIQLVWR